VISLNTQFPLFRDNLAIRSQPEVPPSIFPMKLIPVLSATLLGTVATIALVQPYAVALSPEQVDTLARQVTVQILGQNPGSGVIVAREGQTYYVLTAAHVVPSADEYDVITPDGQKHPIDYKLVRKLPGVDLALVPFTSPKNYQVVTIGSSSQVKAGTLAYISGFPASREVGGKNDYRFTPGRIDAHASRSLANGYALAYFNDTFTGMSGGPIFDQEGKLIGIHGASKTAYTATLGIAPGMSQKIGLNLGIPIDTFLRLAPQVATNLKLPTASSPLVLSETLTADDLFIQALDLGIVSNDKAAILVLERAIRLRPNYTAAFFLRGASRLELNDLQGAIADFNEAIRLDPKFVGALNSRGLTRLDLNDRQGAIADFNEAIRLNPRFVMAFSNRGMTRSDMGDQKGAMADYNEAIRLDPKHAVAFYNRGTLRTVLGDWQGALADFDMAIQLYSGLAIAFYNRGRVRAELRDQQGALLDFTETIRLDPKFAGAYNNRGIIRRQKGDLQGAMADYNEAIRLDPKQAVVLYNRGNVRTVLGDRQGAIIDLQQAATLAQQQGNQRLYQFAVRKLNELGAGFQ
jgi:tetratricopeptide (TPR) repeat protein/S1-C subfamily serine protease